MKKLIFSSLIALSMVVFTLNATAEETPSDTPTTKCSSGKCGDAKSEKCGTGKCSDDKKDTSTQKCGAGKCGGGK